MADRLIDHIRQSSLPTYSATQLVREHGQLQEQSTGQLQRWDMRAWELKWAKEAEPTCLALIAAPNGKRIGASTASGFHLLDAKTGKPKGGLIDATKK